MKNEKSVSFVINTQVTDYLIFCPLTNVLIDSALIEVLFFIIRS